jgi:hypothetical protein
MQMSELSSALLVFAAQVLGWVAGRLIRQRLPPEHLSSSTRDSVMLAVGMVATLSALVLGLMVSTAKSSLDGDRASVVEIGTKVLMIDRALAHYGDEAKPAREVLRAFTEHTIEGVISHSEQQLVMPAQPQVPLPQVGKLQLSLLALSPATDTQRWLKARALTLSGELERERVVFAERGDGSIPPAFLVVLTGWLAMLYVALAIFAPPNATATLTAFGGSFAFAAAIFLILELDTPFHGAIRLSSEPLVETLQLLGR